jgi:hypothetical protein
MDRALSCAVKSSALETSDSAEEMARHARALE